MTPKVGSIVFNLLQGEGKLNLYNNSIVKTCAFIVEILANTNRQQRAILVQWTRGFLHISQTVTDYFHWATMWFTSIYIHWEKKFAGCRKTLQKNSTKRLLTAIAYIRCWHMQRMLEYFYFLRTYAQVVEKRSVFFYIPATNISYCV